MPIWNSRRLNAQERWIMAYVRRFSVTASTTTIGRMTTAYQNHFDPEDIGRPMTKTGIRNLIRSAQLKGAPLATTAHGVVIATSAAVHRQAMRMKIHALGELRNAAILMGTRLNDRLAGQIDAMGRDRARVRA